ncbi:DNA polymerase alpha/epsilon subunit B-domain-containing protein [Fusarium redolens]|uniref:DNA-directed DNA polymerase n=1 Tax=Fusarium redolens TaxID=48865 RepID=A0A9P9KQZ1_FUSRE|nr:DNA polymerase alpha/epsilon subunit B-domain-containing protein [Fusarium redolens]KAH7266908.1 DNA polymerase alpha/epsilon subunit B-domain-containing protein [Fusarium redolens]
MVTLEDVEGSLLRKPSETSHQVPSRSTSVYKPLQSFVLDKQRSYQQQYGDMYFLRLTKIKPAVDKVAAEAWTGTTIGEEEAQRVERVLDVRQGELCWVTGTVYMEMPLKPNILEDVSKDRWISAPILTPKYFSEDDQVMLEDESGRIRLVGDVLKTVNLVTGCIIGVMGTENANGELEVIDIKFPDLPPQPDRWSLSKPNLDKAKTKDEDEDMADGSEAKKGNSKIAIVSGLSFSDTDASHTLELELLLEYLLGEAMTPLSQVDVSHISRLIIAGNSISTTDRKPPAADEALLEKKAQKKYGYDASAYNPLPSQLFDAFVAELLPSIPITMLPGAQDPANASYPQQPVHPAMFPSARAYARDPTAPATQPGWFDTVTNPWEAELEGWRFLGTGGQNVDDIFKYVGSDDRLGMMEAMCRWRCCAPTAPDTLWSYPFQEDDPFVMQTCPHLYFVGNQPQFSTKVIHGPEGQNKGVSVGRCRNTCGREGQDI